MATNYQFQYFLNSNVAKNEQLNESFLNRQKEQNNNKICHSCKILKQQNLKLISELKSLEGSQSYYHSSQNEQYRSINYQHYKKKMNQCLNSLNLLYHCYTQKQNNQLGDQILNDFMKKISLDKTNKIEEMIKIYENNKDKIEAIPFESGDLFQLENKAVQYQNSYLRNKIKSLSNILTRNIYVIKQEFEQLKKQINRKEERMKEDLVKIISKHMKNKSIGSIVEYKANLPNNKNITCANEQIIKDCVKNDSWQKVKYERQKKVQQKQLWQKRKSLTKNSFSFQKSLIQNQSNDQNKQKSVLFQSLKYFQNLNKQANRQEKQKKPSIPKPQKKITKDSKLSDQSLTINLKQAQTHSHSKQNNKAKTLQNSIEKNQKKSKISHKEVRISGQSPKNYNNAKYHR